MTCIRSPAKVRLTKKQAASAPPGTLEAQPYKIQIGRAAYYTAFPPRYKRAHKRHLHNAVVLPPLWGNARAQRKLREAEAAAKVRAREPAVATAAAGTRANGLQQPNLELEAYNNELEDLEMADDFSPTGGSELTEFTQVTLRPRWNTRAQDRFNKRAAQYVAWEALLPSLEEPLLLYLAAVQGDRPRTNPSATAVCEEPTAACTVNTHTILLVSWDRSEMDTVTWCQHQSLAGTLVARGFFPCAPTRPAYAFSVDFLEFYLKLFEHAADSIQAIAAALHDFHSDRGCPLRREDGSPIEEGYRRPLQHASQWYELLRSRVESCVESALQSGRDLVEAESQTAHLPAVGVESAASSTLGPTPPATPRRTPPPTRSTCTEVADEDGFPQTPTTAVAPSPTSARGDDEAEVPVVDSIRVPLTPGECSQLLQSRCPCCYMESLFGRAPSEGADFQISTDANFHHRHSQAAGDCPPFYFEGAYFVSPDKVNAMGERLEAARRHPPKPYTGIVPEVALDGCENAHTAADDAKVKTSGRRFDDKGIMALVCRHDIVIMWCNVDTPGEGQKYAFTFAEEFFGHIPAQATVEMFYDISCVSDRTCNLYDVLAPDIKARLTFTTSAMHAYSHQWACQLAYNPRMKNGSGLSDGEGTERTWSRLRKVIGITRSTSRRRRLFILERQIGRISRSVRAGLGAWLRRRHRVGVRSKLREANEQVAASGLTIPQLREQWSSQRAAQLSLRAHTPQILKKQLQSVLALQLQIEGVEEAIEDAEDTLPSRRAGTMFSARQSIARLRDTQLRLNREAEDLYSSLNVGVAFPRLTGLPPEFTRILLQAHDAKQNLRRRVIGRFLEYDRLDQAVGGRGLALGTKLHQRTRNAMSKRTPALVKAIKRYNNLCARLEGLLPAGSDFPLPRALPLEISKLRADETLLQDVWFQDPRDPAPLWLVNPDVRLGIRAMHTLDRCREEDARLVRETHNLYRWFAREVKALHAALVEPKNSLLRPMLLQRSNDLRAWVHMWPNAIIPPHAWLAAWNTPWPHGGHLDHLPGHRPDSELYPTNDVEAPRMVPTAPHEDEDDTDDEDEAAADDVAHTCFIDLTVSDEDEPEEDLPQQTVEGGQVQPPRLRLTWGEGVPRSERDAFRVGVGVEPLPIDEPLSSRIQPASKALSNVVFSVQTQDALCRFGRMINDEAVNSCSNLLARAFPSDTVAIFQTYDFNRMRDNVPDETMWRHTRRLEFWAKSTWILPFNDGAYHWVLAVIYPRDARIEFFDSLVTKRSWSTQIPAVAAFADRLISIGRERGGSAVEMPQTWECLPINVEAVQEAGTLECGVWVLAQVAAVLRGYRATRVKPSEMEWFRAYLMSLVRAMPCG